MMLHNKRLLMYCVVAGFMLIMTSIIFNWSSYGTIHHHWVNGELTMVAYSCQNDI